MAIKFALRYHAPLHAKFRLLALFTNTIQRLAHHISCLPLGQVFVQTPFLELFCIFLTPVLPVSQTQLSQVEGGAASYGAIKPYSSFMICIVAAKVLF